MADAFTNFAKSTLLAGIAPATTTLTVQAGDGALFPTAGAGQTFRFVLQNAANQREVCICTLRTGDVFNTITRNAEGTAALTWNAGDKVGHRLTAAQLNNILVSSDLQQNTKTWCGTAGGTVNALTLTPAPAVTAMVAGHKFIFKTSGVNTTPVTFAVSGLAPFAGQNNGVALNPGDLEASKWYEVLYDGVNGQIKKYQIAVPALATAKGDLISFDGSLYARVAVGTDNQAVLADSTQTTGLRYVTLGAGSVRQSVQQGVQDANGYANMLTTGAGLRPGLSATAKACIIAFASGFGQAGAADLVSTISADVADPLAADLKLSNTAFVHASYTSPVAVAWGSCYVPPDYGYAFDRSRGALLNFEGVNGAVTTTDDFGNTWTLNNGAQISTAKFKFGTSSLLLDGVNDTATSSSFTSLGDGSWEMSAWFNINALPGVGNQAILFGAQNAGGFNVLVYLNNVAGTTKLDLNVSSNGTSEDIANGVAGTNTVWTLNQWNKVRLVFDALAGTYKVYLSLNAAAETADISVASAARALGVTSFVIGGATASFFNGNIDAFRFIRAATNTTTETPAAVAPAIGDYPYHWFSIPDMKMYEATAASAVAGVNPTLTARNRCFIGEADTSGAAVTAVRSYALRGKYFAEFTPAGPSQTIKSHNIGIRPAVRVALVCTTKDASGGHFVGDEVIASSYYDGTSFRLWCVVTDRNSAFFDNSASGLSIGDRSGATFTNITYANWKVRMYCERNF